VEDSLQSIKKTYYSAIRPVAFLNYMVTGTFCILLIQEKIGREIERTYFVYFFSKGGQILSLGLGTETTFHKDLDWQEEFFRLATEDEVAKAIMLGL
jgi:hypothetical protein